MTEKTAMKLFKKQLDRQHNETETDLNALSMETLVELMTQYKLGGYGHYIFSKYLEDRRPKYKELKMKRKKV
jgi:hypothetical protein